jgi:phosphoribosylanthranilate isomerase
MALTRTIRGAIAIALVALAAACTHFTPYHRADVTGMVAAPVPAAIDQRVLSVGVFVDASYEQIRETLAQTGVVCAQLHGDESPALLERLLPHAYKAIRVRDQASLAQARGFLGEHILLDAYVSGQAGGTGQSFNWALATELARERKVTLAGGLDPSNVAAAIAVVRPFCVDVASGVEPVGAPGHKDPDKVKAFIAAARALPNAAEFPSALTERKSR